VNRRILGSESGPVALREGHGHRDGQRVAYDEHTAPGTADKLLERAAVARDRLKLAFASLWWRHGRLVGPEPVQVRRERPLLEVPEARVVEVRSDEVRDAAALEGDGRGLLRPAELARDAQRHGIRGETVSEGARLAAAERTEGAEHGGVSVGDASYVEIALPMAAEDEELGHVLLCPLLL
jgi:hypothetical protein